MVAEDPAVSEAGGRAPGRVGSLLMRRRAPAPTAGCTDPCPHLRTCGGRGGWRGGRDPPSRHLHGSPPCPLSLFPMRPSRPWPPPASPGRTSPNPSASLPPWQGHHAMLSSAHTCGQKRGKASACLCAQQGLHRPCLGHHDVWRPISTVGSCACWGTYAPESHAFGATCSAESCVQRLVNTVEGRDPKTRSGVFWGLQTGPGRERP